LLKKLASAVPEIAVLGKTFAPFPRRSILLIIAASPLVLWHREGDQNALARDVVFGMAFARSFDRNFLVLALSANGLERQLSIQLSSAFPEADGAWREQPVEGTALGLTS
jgi:hypothetical protein